MSHQKTSLRTPFVATLLSIVTCLAISALPAGPVAFAQTLARPGWAGSGMLVERWWPHAVLCEVRPDSLPATSATAAEPTLRRLADRLDDLQTLGVDGVLLHGLEADPQGAAASAANAPAGAIRIDERYGSLEDLDALVNSAVRHGMRVLVELRPGATGQALNDGARFWLNRGVTGLALPGADPSGIRALRSALHGYVGERILIAEASAVAGATASPQAGTTRHVSTSPARAEQPDLFRIALPTTAQGAAPLRAAIERARAILAARGPIPLLHSEEGETSDPASRRALATVLLGSGGAVLVRADDLDLAHAATPDQASLFAWYRLWSGLHRGNTILRNGEDTLLDHDAAGALVWVRQARGNASPIVVIANVTGQPIRLSLLDDMHHLSLRGSFLRTLARSDGGMGAMPLREVVLPAYGVYAGTLSR